MGSLGSEGLHVDFVCVHSDLPCIYLKTDGYQDRKHYFQRFGVFFQVNKTASYLQTGGLGI